MASNEISTVKILFFNYRSNLTLNLWTIEYDKSASLKIFGYFVVFPLFFVFPLFIPHSIPVPFPLMWIPANLQQFYNLTYTKACLPLFAQHKMISLMAGLFPLFNLFKK